MAKESFFRFEEIGPRVLPLMGEIGAIRNELQQIDTCRFMVFFFFFLNKIEMVLFQFQKVK